jgi:cytochrome P450
VRIEEGTPAAVALDDIDLADPAGYRTGQLHGAWRTLRRQAPVWWHDRPPVPGFWAVTSHAGCERVIKDHRTFSSEHGTILGTVGPGDPAGGRTISLMDPPAHTVLRTEAMRSFSHAVVRAEAPRMRHRVGALVDRLADGEPDFAVLTRLLPMVVSGTVMGIPEEHWEPLAYWSAAGLSPDDPAYDTGAGTAATLGRAHHEIFARFSAIIREKRARPRNDLISALLGLRPHGRPLEDGDILLNCYSFMAGANSTTPHVAAHTLTALIDRPAVWARVAADPELVPALIEEGVRWTSTPHHLVRRATTGTVLEGVPIAAGDWVCAWLPSANRDERVFADPYTFDITRSPNQHIGFGAGPHYCIGAPMSRMALRLLFTDLLDRFAGIEPVDEPRHLYSNWINGLVSMPVRAKPR